MAERTKSKVLNYVEKALSEQTTLYYGCQTPKWIRDKTDAKAGDTVTVYGIPKKEKTKPYQHKEEGYAIISRKRVYNGTLLLFDGNKWLRLDGGKSMINLTKHQFKICEAVHLKMDYYYMGPCDRRKLTGKDRKEASLLLQHLPHGWWAEEQEWFCNKDKSKKRKTK